MTSFHIQPPALFHPVLQKRGQETGPKKSTIRKKDSTVQKEKQRPPVTKRWDLAVFAVHSLCNSAAAEKETPSILQGHAQLSRCNGQRVSL